LNIADLTTTTTTTTATATATATTRTRTRTTRTILAQLLPDHWPISSNVAILPKFPNSMAKSGKILEVKMVDCCQKNQPMFNPNDLALLLVISQSCLTSLCSHPPGMVSGGVFKG